MLRKEAGRKRRGCGVEVSPSRASRTRCSTCKMYCCASDCAGALDLVFTFFDQCDHHYVL